MKKILKLTILALINKKTNARDGKNGERSKQNRGTEVTKSPQVQGTCSNLTAEI